MIRKVLFKSIEDWNIDAGVETDDSLLHSHFYGPLPITTPEELQNARRILHNAIIQYHIENGVDIVDPATTFIGPDAVIGRGTTILPGVVIQGKVKIGEGCEIGPFTHIRPGVTLGSTVKAGAFVEMKNSTIGSGTQAAHLVYVGNAKVGKNVNLGCGMVTINFDGAKYHRTVIKDGAFIGCNTNLVAPVTVGEGAFTAAGSTLTRDVPPNSLAIARARQDNKNNWKPPKERSDD